MSSKFIQNFTILTIRSRVSCEQWTVQTMFEQYRKKIRTPSYIRLPFGNKFPMNFYLNNNANGFSFHSFFVLYFLSFIFKTIFEMCIIVCITLHNYFITIVACLLWKLRTFSFKVLKAWNSELREHWNTEYQNKPNVDKREKKKLFSQNPPTIPSSVFIAQYCQCRL